MKMKRIVILGGGISGYGSAVLARTEGCDVFLSEAGRMVPDYKAELERLGIPFEEGGHTRERILSADEVVKSPGIPDSVPIVKALLEKGIPVVSEIEFAGRYTSAKTICVTGSNGKTTTTGLIYEMLRQGGFNVGLAGNIGESFALRVADDMAVGAVPRDWYVLELSSFQLDGCRDFRADIAVLTNITPDHLDRYGGSFERYAASKMRITRNQRPEDTFVYQADDPVTARMVAASGGLGMRVCTFMGPDNVAAASLAAAAAGVSADDIARAVAGFRTPDHRMQSVGVLGGAEWVNDSKATNVEAVVYAFRQLAGRQSARQLARTDDCDSPSAGRSTGVTQSVGEVMGERSVSPSRGGGDGLTTSCGSRIVWIAGGTDKGNDYTPLFEFMPRVRALVCMGLDNGKLVREFTGRVPRVVSTHSMEDALAAARELAEPGDTVLLSPACASFDLFKNYEDRGDRFKKWVQDRTKSYDRK